VVGRGSFQPRSCGRPGKGMGTLTHTMRTGRGDEVSSGVAVAGEMGGAVAVVVLLIICRAVSSWDSDGRQQGAERSRRDRSSSRFYVVEKAGSEEKSFALGSALLRPIRRTSSEPILFSVLNGIRLTRSRCVWCDQWAKFGALFHSVAYLRPTMPMPSLPKGVGRSRFRRYSHWRRPGSVRMRTRRRRRRERSAAWSEVGIRNHDHVVFAPPSDRTRFAVLCPRAVDVFAIGGRADEAPAWMVGCEESSLRRLCLVDDV